MYHITVYEPDGQVLLDEAIEASSDQEARDKGLALIAEKGYDAKPHRIFHVSGRLVSFKPHQVDLKTGKATP
ncbi:YhzD family protein [Staphylospora marina]|uniref:YhzD family protein n=1 Tax=Staphylospora marina TaxID=2490858 RepID=UPI000F5B9FD9|nr:YhzD family protein [Staphylospora marina]